MVKFRAKTGKVYKPDAERQIGEMVEYLNIPVKGTIEVMRFPNAYLLRGVYKIGNFGGAIKEHQKTIQRVPSKELFFTFNENQAGHQHKSGLETDGQPPGKQRYVF